MASVRDRGGGEAGLRFGSGERVAVLLPLPLAGPYDYRVPPGLAVVAGDFVEAPLGARSLAGVVWGGGSDAVEEAKLKPLGRLLPAPPLPEVSRQFVDWVAGYTVHPPGAVLRMVMSVPEALAPAAPQWALRKADHDAGIKPTAARARVLAVLADGPPRPLAELAREAACSQAVVRGLVAAGALIAEAMQPQPEAPPDWRRAGFALSPAQAEAARALRVRIARRFSVSLVDGVPGSGKTEVYFEAMAAALAHDLQVLVLLPEIALGAQWRARFRARFGAPPREWHSDLGRLERRQTWRAVAEGETCVVVGARSALFLPFRKLGLIVVDEEHDASFKQEDGVTYHARDMAVVRAWLGDIPSILVSATPSLETVVNAHAGRYAELSLPDRAGGGRAPLVEVIDLRGDRPPKGGFVSPSLRGALVETLAAGEQALLFLNRRGYAPLTLCRTCGHRIDARPAPPGWSSTGSSGGCYAIIAASPRRTERLPELRRARQPGRLRPRGRAAGRGGGGACPRRSHRRRHLRHAARSRRRRGFGRRIEAHEVDILIGTQIIAKGYHFPLLTLVGVVDADLGLVGRRSARLRADLSAAVQVARPRRAGREAGRVLLQTFWPEHPVSPRSPPATARAFFRRGGGTASRRMPPFGRLAALIVSGRDEAAVDSASRALARAAPAIADVRVLGPAPAPLALLRGRHRRRLLAHSGRAFALSAYVRDWLAAVSLPGSVRVQVDIDPQGFL